MNDEEEEEEAAQRAAASGLAPSERGEPRLAVRNLEVVYHDVILVVRGVSLEVGAGEIVTLLGANGAGKTTLLRAVSGLLGVHRGKVTKGEIRVDGEPIARLDPAAIVARGVAQVMEGRRTFSELTVEENLQAGAFTRRDRDGIGSSFERVFSLFPVLAERRRATAGYLSGGEQQMLAIGRALMADPELLMLDEPSLGLAPALVEQIAEIVAAINRQGTSVLLVEQNADMALGLADRGYVLETGRVVLEGSAEELRANRDVRESYLGLAEDGGSFREAKTYRRKKGWAA